MLQRLYPLLPLSPNLCCNKVRGYTGINQLSYGAIFEMRLH